MHNAQKTTWDMGFADMIEETPEVNPHQPTRFHVVVDSYLKRPVPSWETSKASEMVPPRNRSASLILVPTL